MFVYLLTPPPLLPRLSYPSFVRFCLGSSDFLSAFEEVDRDLDQTAAVELNLSIYRLNERVDETGKEDLRTKVGTGLDLALFKN